MPQNRTIKKHTKAVIKLNVKATKQFVTVIYAIHPYFQLSAISESELYHFCSDKIHLRRQNKANFQITFSHVVRRDFEVN